MLMYGNIVQKAILFQSSEDFAERGFKFKEFHEIQRLLKYDSGCEVGRLRRAE